MFKVVWLAAIPGMLAAQDARTVLNTLLNNAVKAMGSENLRTIQFSGMGSYAGIGQNVNPKAGWPMTRLKSYRRDMDLASASSHVQMVRLQGAADQTVNQFISPDSPWDSQFEFWLSPYGFLKGAVANNAAAEGHKDVVELLLANKAEINAN
jgi:hypothetical protein